MVRASAFLSDFNSYIYANTGPEQHTVYCTKKFCMLGVRLNKVKTAMKKFAKRAW